MFQVETQTLEVQTKIQSSGDAFFEQVVQMVAASQGEILVFVLAAFTHFMLFGKRSNAKRVTAKHPRAHEGANAASPKNLTSPTQSAAVTSVQQVRMSLQAGTTDIESLVLYEKHLAGVNLSSDLVVEKTILQAALRCARWDILKQLVNTSLDTARLVTLLKNLGTDKRLGDALNVFRACNEKPACLYNTFLEACVHNHDLERAERVFAEASAAGLADVITYNTIIKAHLQAGNFRSARAALEGMRAANVAPSCVTFNEFLDASSGNAVSPWSVVEEMKACGLAPNPVTCSILLKKIQPRARPADLERTLAIVGGLGDEMDEVLLSSVCEACVRCNRADLLVQQLQRQRSSKRVQVRGAATYGSVIRAYGFIRDIEGVWETWREMRSRNIVPTSITLGCMIEALVTNTSPETGHQMVQESLADAQTQPLVNVVMYCSIMKGYSHQKRFDRMWDVYQEMLSHKMQLSIVTFNTLVDACARCGEISFIPTILEGMRDQGVKPNTITYSAIIKGYCNHDQLSMAFELLDEMKRTPANRPDEITYNTVLDGCARYSEWDKGMEVLDDMQGAGIPPSNFTLSVLVKLANRCRRFESAFEMVDKLSKKYGIRLNIHVYNNLVNICVGHGQYAQAIEVFMLLLHEQVRPDQRTYALVLRGCVAAGEARQAAGLLRAGVGLPGAHPKITGELAALARPQGGLPAELISEVLVSMVTQLDNRCLAVQLFQELKCAPGVRLDAKLAIRLTTEARST